MPIRPIHLLLAAAACLALTQAAAQGERPNLNQEPSPEQLLQQPVGGTHIPQREKPQELHNPYEGNSDAVAEGEKLFHHMNCIGCHAPQGGGGIGPPLSDKVWIYGGHPAQIYLSIMQGRPNGMPSFARALTSDQIWKLVTYVQTLSQSPKDTVGKPPQTMQSGKP